MNEPQAQIIAELRRQVANVIAEHAMRLQWSPYVNPFALAAEIRKVGESQPNA